MSCSPRKNLIAKNLPNLVRRFLKASFSHPIAYMKAHKEETDASSALKESPTSASKTYDYLISALSNDADP